ncbi:MAG: 1-deoxy-D-xylulose-5-phosphate reductoisomerase [Burkholderiaceae bacterium]|nr:1-deoxy-D-xylulose-5-phosphate reductoisomerase [Burkholderiaceae bacterium]
MKKRLAVLGSTGSIGVSTLDVVARHEDQFEVHALTAATKVDLMLAQCVRFKPAVAVMASEAHGRQLQQQVEACGLSTEVRWSPAAIDEVAVDERVDIVMAAIVGAAGLSSCIAAARAGKRLLLANKEALVVGGEVFLQAVHEGGCRLLPIDSEHSAIFQALPEDPSFWPARVDKIILTASGGPFRTRSPQTLKDVTPEEACAHPNWEMGRKISVDSATMMNKALEVIEARYLFGLPPQQIEVVLHPQSIIHSMVQFKDHSVVAQMGTPDMRGPIAYGLSWPERMVSGAAALDFQNSPPMTFESLSDAGHQDRYPGLALAWQALAGKPGTCAVLNAANEVAVAAFLDRRVRFDQIHHINVQTLSTVDYQPPSTLADLLELDRLARTAAQKQVRVMSRT